MLQSRSDRTDESELVRRLLDGDEAAFCQLIREYQPGMQHLARSIVGEAIAEEVVQEAWLAVIRALPKFEQRASLKTWILRIVGNHAKTRLRKESRQINFSALGEDAYPEPERFRANGHWNHPPAAWHAERPEDLLASEQLRRRLQAAIEQLPPNQQSVLLLRDRENLSMQDICKILELSDSNVRVLLHRARTRLWRVIEQYEEDPSC